MGEVKQVKRGRKSKTARARLRAGRGMKLVVTKRKLIKGRISRMGGTCPAGKRGGSRGWLTGD